MPSHLKICSSLNQDCCLLNSDGTCSNPTDFCEDQIRYQSTNEFVVTRNMMQNFRALHQENMELKKLLLELKQNQK